MENYQKSVFFAAHVKRSSGSNTLTACRNGPEYVWKAVQIDRKLVAL